jgi:hypothetical protein
MFGSFLFADSDPLNKAAFLVSSSPSIQLSTTQERQTNDCSMNDQNNTSSGIQTASPSPLEDIASNDDDEDDFDGIPIRHSSIMIKTKLNGDSDSMQNHLVDELVHPIEASHDENDLEDDSFLNGFTDEQHDVTPSLFKDIPDIDDPNEPEEDDDQRIPFDHMDDMYDQSESIRSSSPDSLLSSSHLQDEQDDDIDIDDEVAQWNDDLILNTTTSNNNTQENSSVIFHSNPLNQVDFIDSSRSNSRCSNVSSHLSIGYADQARQFLSDDGLLTSSDSDSDDNANNDDIQNFNCDTLDRDDDIEDLCLQVNLDDHRSISSFSHSNSTRSSSPIQDETPIIDIDDDHTQSNPSQIAPIAAIDDDDDLSNQPILSILTANLYKSRQNDIVHDIINIRHLFNENDHDDEFVAIMHNPKIFEQVLYDQEVIILIFHQLYCIMQL